MYILFNFLSIFSLSISEIPLWNISKAAINLLSNSNTHNYTIFDRSMNNMNLRLEKKIYKQENGITQKNYLYIDNELVNDVDIDWEDIESFYNIKGIKYICPKGRYFMYKYENSKLDKLKPDVSIDLKEDSEWELKCFHQKNESLLFNFFLGNEKASSEYYGYIYDSKRWFYPSTFYSYRMYDLKLTTEDPTGNHIYPLIGIEYDSSEFLIRSINIKIDVEYAGNEGASIQENGKRPLIQTLHENNRYAYFDIYNNNFYNGLCTKILFIF